MTDFLKENGVPKKPLKQKKAILLLNLGSPASPKAQDLRPYLNQFLSDFRVVDLPKWKWQPILKLFVLTFRPKKSAEKYKIIWDKEKGSPLIHYTLSMAQKLESMIKEHLKEDVEVFASMTYGSPSCDEVMQKMKERNVTEILAIPLFPQYASCASGAALDALWRTLLKTFVMPSIHTYNDFWEFDPWQEAVATHIKNFWQANGGKAQHLIFSYHSQPMTQHERGDIYVAQCYASSDALANKLGLQKDEYSTTFQSVFGKGEWVKPNTQDTLVQMGQKKFESVDVFSPVFICDCLETIEELGMECRDLFISNGGKQFRHIPCLNDSEEWLEALFKLIRSYCTEPERL